MNYHIQRPPLKRTFELPTREDLLSLEKGDSAKLIFQVDNEVSERMWIRIEDCSDDHEWIGVIDNDAVGEETSRALEAGIKVTFHPLDIIDFLKRDLDYN